MSSVRCSAVTRATANGRRERRGEPVRGRAVALADVGDLSQSERVGVVRNVAQASNCDDALRPREQPFALEARGDFADQVAPGAGQIRERRQYPHRRGAEREDADQFQAVARGPADALPTH